MAGRVYREGCGRYPRRNRAGDIIAVICLRRAGFHFDPLAIPPASRNFHVYETAGQAQKIT